MFGFILGFRICPKKADKKRFSEAPKRTIGTPKTSTDLWNRILVSRSTMLLKLITNSPGIISDISCSQLSVWKFSP